jgi:hypothetical protein
VWAATCTLLGGLAMLAILARRYGGVDTLLVGCGLLGEIGAVVWWAGRYEPESVLGNYRHVMRLNTVAASALALYLLARIAYA